MSHPDPTHDSSNEYPEDNVTHYPKKKKSINYTGSHPHAHNKGGLLGALKGLQETKHFGAKHGARHQAAKSKALKNQQTLKVARKEFKGQD